MTSYYDVAVGGPCYFTQEYFSKMRVVRSPAECVKPWSGCKMLAVISGFLQWCAVEVQGLDDEETAFINPIVIGTGP